jgi:carboxyl-terminal processing protease
MMRRPRTLQAAIACVLLALAAGLWLGGHPRFLPNGIRNAFVEDDRALRAELIDTIEDNYYKKVDPDRLEEASLQGMVRALGDRFSHYYPPKETKLFNQSLSGRFDGVGMTVQPNKRGLLVSGVFPGSPAQRAGMHRDDVVTAVNRKSIAGMPSEIATAKIKGPRGTFVKLSVLSPTTHKTRVLTLRRERIEVPVSRGRVVSRAGKRLGVVQLTTFSEGAHGELRRTVEKVLRQGAGGIVLDLRGNGGGLLQEGVLVASQFIERGPIVFTKGRRKPKREYDATGDAVLPSAPLVVLVDHGSASASEIVTGALRDRGRATVVGERTFGKGVFQEVEPLSNGGALDITVGSYYLPSGQDISMKGITPSIKAKDRPRTKRDEALDVALATLAARVR